MTLQMQRLMMRSFWYIAAVGVCNLVRGVSGQLASHMQDTCLDAVNKSTAETTDQLVTHHTYTLVQHLDEGVRLTHLQQLPLEVSGQGMQQGFAIDDEGIIPAISRLSLCHALQCILQLLPNLAVGQRVCFIHFTGLL